MAEAGERGTRRRSADDDDDDAWNADDDEAGVAGLSGDNFRTPKLGSSAHFDESTFATPTVAHYRTRQETASSEEDVEPARAARQEAGGDAASETASREPVTSPDAYGREEDSIDDDDDGPPTARPWTASRKSSTATTSTIGPASMRSPDLYELAAMHQPDQPTSLVVADAAGGYFESVSLATPTVEHFSTMEGSGGMHWNGNGYRGAGAHRPGWNTSFAFSSASGREDAAAQSRARRKSGPERHRHTASDASASSAGSLKGARRASWYAPASISTPNFALGAVEAHGGAERATAEPIDIDSYNPRASTSSSSIADSVGTAGEASDSEYEEQRSRSVSRPTSRKPSSDDLAGILSGSKRLSSFAPIKSISFNSSQTNLANAAGPSLTSTAHADSVRDQEASQSLTGGSSQGRSPGGSSQKNSETSDSLTPDYQPPGKRLDSSPSSLPDAQGDGDGRSAEHSAEMHKTSSAQSDGSTASSATSSVQSSPGQAGEGSTPVTSLESTAANGKPPRIGKKQKASILQKVMSKTRPRDLPPKDKQEDKKHLKEYEEMVLASKAAEKKRQTILAAKVQQKQLLANQALPTWEKSILPNWKAVLRDEKLRDTWWSGTMPPRHRARLWQGCIGNGLALGKASYNRSMVLVQAHIKAGRFTKDMLESIEADIKLTLPQTKLFQEGRPLYADLRDLLMAHSVFWKETPMYVSGISHIGAMLLVTMPVQEAFLCLVNLVNKTLLKTFYAGSSDDVEAYYRVFNTLLADKMPKIYRNFVGHDIRASLFLKPWLTTLYSRHLGFDTATRIWDVFVLEGDQFLYRVALATLQILEARLFNPDHVELAELFRGEDRGGRAIVSREQYKSDDQVEPWEVYECLGVTEEALFATMKQMEWKEATFQRLLTRELPDADA